MRPIYAVHIVAGGLALLSGYVAIFAAKGDRLHRKAGTLFVYAMLTMCAGGFVLALGKKWQVVNIPAAVMTAYLVITSLTTIRPRQSSGRLLHVGGMVVAAIVGVTTLVFGFQAVAAGGNRDG